VIDKKKLIDQHYYVRPPHPPRPLPLRQHRSAHHRRRSRPRVRSIRARRASPLPLLDRSQAIASKATILKPDALNVPADKFNEKFGTEVRRALLEYRSALPCLGRLRPATT
jgi:hypothetical protein